MHLKVSGISPERADPLLHPAMSQEAFYLGWVLIAATLPYRPEQVSLPCLSSPSFAGYLRKLQAVLCTEVDSISIFRSQGYFCTRTGELSLFPACPLCPQSLSVAVLDGMSGTSLAVQTLKIHPVPSVFLKRQS